MNDNNEKDDQNHKPKKYKKEIIIGVVILVVLIIGLYAGIKYYSENDSTGNTNANWKRLFDKQWGFEGDDMRGGSIFSFLFGKNNNRLAYVNMINSTDANIELIEPITCVNIGKLEYPDKQNIIIKTKNTLCNNIIWCPKGELLAINGVYPNDKVIIIEFDGYNKVKKVIELKNKACSYMAWKPDGKELALIEEETPNKYCIKTYYSSSGDINLTGPVSGEQIVSLSWSKNNEIAYVMSNKVYVLTVKTMKLTFMDVEKVDIPKINEVNYISWCPDGIVLAIVYNSNTVILCNTEDFSVSGLITSYLDKPDIKVNNIKSLQWNSDGKKLAGIADHAIIIWIFDKDGKKDIIRNAIKETNKEDGIIHSFSWCPNKPLFAYNTKQKIMICDLYTLECNKTYEYSNYKQSSISWAVY